MAQLSKSQHLAENLMISDVTQFHAHQNFKFYIRK